MEHIVSLEHGYDCIRFECFWGKDKCKPGTGGSHGVHGLSIRFLSKGLEGAVQFLLYTGWLPQKVEVDSIGYRNITKWGTESSMMPSDLGYHSKKPRYEGHSSVGPCKYCDGEECYYAGSGLNASDAMYTLVNGGGDALWEFLDAYYEYVFHNQPYPIPAEYEKPLR